MTKLRSVHAFVVLSVLALGLTACGGDDSDSSADGSAVESAEESSARVFNDDEVWEHIGATYQENLTDYTFPLSDSSLCRVEILNNKSDVELYAEAGDLVAPNAGGWMGLRISSVDGRDADCLAEGERLIKDFE